METEQAPPPPPSSPSPPASPAPATEASPTAELIGDLVIMAGTAALRAAVDRHVLHKGHHASNSKAKHLTSSEAKQAQNNENIDGHEEAHEEGHEGGQAALSSDQNVHSDKNGDPAPREMLVHKAEAIASEKARNFAKKSAPAAALVGAGLILKNLYDRGGRRKARDRAAQG